METRYVYSIKIIKVYDEFDEEWVDETHEAYDSVEKANEACKKLAFEKYLDSYGKEPTIGSLDICQDECVAESFHGEDGMARYELFDTDEHYNGLFIYSVYKMPLH